MHPSRLVVAQWAALRPVASLVIAVDTGYVASRGQGVETGIYMMDNQLLNGSTGEGTMQLAAVVPVGKLVSFETVPVDARSGDSVIITSFSMSQGDIFGCSGYPQQQPPLPGRPPGSYWIGRAVNQGVQTYQVQIRITRATIRPMVYFVNWSAMLTAH
jgi:hypothetical protein